MPEIVSGKSRIYVCSVDTIFPRLSVAIEKKSLKRWTFGPNQYNWINFSELCCLMMPFTVHFMNDDNSFMVLITFNYKILPPCHSCNYLYQWSTWIPENNWIPLCQKHSSKSSFVPCSIRRKLVPTTILLDPEWLFRRTHIAVSTHNSSYTVIKQKHRFWFSCITFTWPTQ